MKKLYHSPLKPMPDIPIPNHYGAFGVKRKYDTHRGVDLYCDNGSPVYAVEDGVVEWEDNAFTGINNNTEWWNDTEALYIEGDTGCMCYGEITIRHDINLKEGIVVDGGTLIGHVRTVLKQDKGKPMSMLHFELHRHGYAFRRSNGIYEMQLDPTLILMQCK